MSHRHDIAVLQLILWWNREGAIGLASAAIILGVILAVAIGR